MRKLPALDTHAHIDSRITASELEGLGAVVFAATRSLDEFELVRARADQLCVWGVGCHPGLASALDKFEPQKFSDQIMESPLVSEVGLDSSSRTSRTRQREVFDQVCRVLAEHPRLVSVHSRGASSEVLDALDHSAMRPGVILHWWRGSPSQTRRAVSMGCYFSLNSSMLGSLGLLTDIPVQRWLLETDHPYGDKRQEVPGRPGRMSPVEEGLAAHLGLTTEALRMLTWKNLATASRAVGVTERFPLPVQRMILFAEGSGNT